MCLRKGRDILKGSGRKNKKRDCRRGGEPAMDITSNYNRDKEKKIRLGKGIKK